MNSSKFLEKNDNQDREALGKQGKHRQNFIFNQFNFYLQHLKHAVYGYSSLP